MRRIYVPSKNMDQYAGKWVAIDTKSDRIIAAGKTLQEISHFVTGKTDKKDKITAAAFKVPRKDEGPYILILS